ncbi:hypothetical protein GUJ93_ZPchr0006g43200 [Zizania palustris]|uniref:Uncharacterized protein n=1 Tax=Zizania palustris TaxID=103762 RepID=A0A8J5T603_ZIZPA|nr:hypothetical protein GUJ93_ZPchr0006g43200 [Zizania palustris]
MMSSRVLSRTGASSWSASRSDDFTDGGVPGTPSPGAWADKGVCGSASCGDERATNGEDGAIGAAGKCWVLPPSGLQLVPSIELNST